MAMAAAGDVTTVQVEEDPEPTQADGPSTETSGEPTDIQKDFDRLLLTKITNNFRSLFGIVISKYYTENNETKKRFLGTIDSDKLDSYEEAVFRLMERLEDADIQDPEGFVIEKERKSIQQHLVALDGRIKSEDFESSIVYQAAMQSFNAAEMRLAAMHQLLVRKNVRLDTLSKKIEDLGILTRNNSNAGVNKLTSYLRDIIKAEKLSTEVEREVEDMEKYIEAYNSLLKEFLYIHLRDLKALDESKRDPFLKVEGTHKYLKRVLEDFSRRRTQSEQTGEGDNYLLLNDPKLVLKLWEKVAVLDPQILAEQVIGLAYAAHINEQIQQDMGYWYKTYQRVFPNLMEPHITTLNSRQKECVSAGDKLFSRLINSLLCIDKCWQRMGNNEGQQSNISDEIIHHLSEINEAMEDFGGKKNSDRESKFFKESRKAFETERKTLNKNNLRDKLTNVLFLANRLRVGVIHETLVTTDMTMSSSVLLKHVSKYDGAGDEFENAAGFVRNQVNSVKHQLDPSIDIDEYITAVEYIISVPTTANQHLVLMTYSQKWWMGTLEKYVNAYKLGQKWIVDHTTKCPRRDEYLKQVKGELDDVKGKLAEANRKLAEANIAPK